MSSTSLTRDDLLKGCHSLVDGLDPAYGYTPSRAAGIVFVILFFIILIGHSFRYARTRGWASLMLGLGAFTELLGWTGRVWSSKCPYNNSAFLMQITTLVIAPVFIAAAIYFQLSDLTQRRGTEYSLLRPKLYIWIFCTFDVLALLVSASGAAIASKEFNKVDGDPSHGTNIIFGGIIIQLLAMSVFVLCLAVFFNRSRKSTTPLPRSDGALLVAIVISLCAIYVRNIFRAVQQRQGFSGYLAVHERFFIALDGAMMVIAISVFNIYDIMLVSGNSKPTTDGGENLEMTQGTK